MNEQTNNPTLNPTPIQFTFEKPAELHTPRPGNNVLKIVAYEVLDDGRISWELRSIGDRDPIFYTTTTTARAGNRLDALLTALDYPASPERIARLRPEWLVGLEIVAEVKWTLDDETGDVTATLKPIGQAKSHTRPYPWEEQTPRPVMKVRYVGEPDFPPGTRVITLRDQMEAASG